MKRKRRRTGFHVNDAEFPKDTAEPQRRPLGVLTQMFLWTLKQFDELAISKRKNNPYHPDNATTILPAGDRNTETGCGKWKIQKVTMPLAKIR